MKMKTLFFAVLVTVSSMASAFGKDEPGMTVVSVKGSEVFKVIYKGAVTGKVRLNIFDAQGAMIHTETIHGLNGFIYPLNFKGMKSGDYTIELVDHTQKFREKVSYLPVYEMKSVHISKLKGEEGKFLLAIANAQNEPITVRIFDEDQRVVFAESKTVYGDFAQVFKMENIYSRYTFEISDTSGNKKYFNFR